MHRSTSTAVAVVLAAGLLFSLVAEIWLVPAGLSQSAEIFPEVRPAVGPAIAWEIIGFACWQIIVGLLIYSLIGAPSRGRGIPRRSLYIVMAIAAGVYVLLTIGALVALQRADFSTPIVMFGLIGSGVLALVVGAAFAWQLGVTPEGRRGVTTS